MTLWCVLFHVDHTLTECIAARDDMPLIYINANLRVHIFNYSVNFVMIQGIDICPSVHGTYHISSPYLTHRCILGSNRTLLILKSIEQTYLSKCKFWQICTSASALSFICTLSDCGKKWPYIFIFSIVMHVCYPNAGRSWWRQWLGFESSLIY